MSGFDEVFSPDGTLISSVPSPSLRLVTPAAFARRFTAGEMKAIETNDNESVIALRVRLFTRVDLIDLTSPDIQQAMLLFQSLGIITAERAAEIVA